MSGQRVYIDIEQRSRCPIASTLDLLGDRWSLLVVRDILFLGKSSYSELLESEEKIPATILYNCLIVLTTKGIIGYTGINDSKVYFVTELGMDLKPVLDAMIIFGFEHFKGSKQFMVAQLKNRPDTARG